MVEQVDHPGRPELIEWHIQFHPPSAGANGAGATQANRSAAGEETERLLPGCDLLVSAGLLVS